MIPILIGAAIIGVFELRDLVRIRQGREEGLVGFLAEKESGDGAHFPAAFRSDFWLQLKRFKKRTPSQLDMFENMVEDDTPRRRVQILPTPTGDIFVLNAQRYHEVLLDRMLENVDKATEHALAVAFKTHGTRLSSDDIATLLSKLFRETVKNDFRGNVAKLLSKIGEEIIVELIESAEPQTKEQTPRKKPAPPEFKLQA